ncbi:MAG: hypothetical protein ACP5PK_01595 [candidate division WOR-3 bacterium]
MCFRDGKCDVEVVFDVKSNKFRVSNQLIDFGLIEIYTRAVWGMVENKVGRRVPARVLTVVLRPVSAVVISMVLSVVYKGIQTLVPATIGTGILPTVVRQVLRGAKGRGVMADVL